MRTKKSVFEYDNYREFLKDSYESLKAKDPKYSYRYFSKLAGFKSSSVMKMIMDGKRNMGSGTIDQFANVLKLTTEEASFFRALVLFNQAKATEEKQIYSRELMHYRNFKRNHPLTEAHYNFYSNWYTVVIWELVGTQGFQNNPEWIAKKIKPAISASDARKSIADLMQLGLIERSKNGRLVKTQLNLLTANEVVSSAIAQWHREMIRRAADSIDSVPREQREISGLTCAMSRATAKKIKEKIQTFRQELLDFASQDQFPEVVYQVNFQMFPQSNIEDDNIE